MTHELWVQPIQATKAVATAALEAGANALVVTKDQQETVSSLARIPVAILDGQDLQLEEGTGRVVTIQSPEDQEAAKALLGKVDVLLVESQDWTIIPLENLIAWARDQGTKLLARVRDAAEAELALGTLETGVHGVVLTTDDPALVRQIARMVAPETPELELVEARIARIEDAGMGDRVCVDTTSLLAPDEGLLVGSASSFLVLVASEASEAGYVASRPFRVNAGAVHAYVQADPDRTHYLSEVQAGTRLMTCKPDGTTRIVTTGRAKVERRPMLVLHLETADRKGSTVLQNAETIRLVTPEGPRSISELEPGDTVYAHLAHQGGRHFGEKVDETIHEA
ncbi:MAG: 3-dehydroquinate synthase II [Candidatus Thermoplasmatota archaeon]|nr:3-dehydroquinate synthase II [Candidatus Thermoplasmatota archaeon]